MKKLSFLDKIIYFLNSLLAILLLLSYLLPFVSPKSIAIFAILITPIVLLSKRIKRIKRTGLQWLALCILWCFIATLGMGFIMLSGPLKPLIILPLFVVFLALANAVVFWFSMNVFRGNVVKIVERKSHPTMVIMDIMVTIIAVVALAVMTWLPLTVMVSLFHSPTGFR